MMDALEEGNLVRVRTLLGALAEQVTGERLAAFYDPAVVQEELPNRLVPQGVRRGLAELLEGAERGKALMSSQRYDIRKELVQGETVVVEVDWAGTVAADRGPFHAGQVLRARFCCIFEFRDSKVIAQRNYDCFEPF